MNRVDSEQTIEVGIDGFKPTLKWATKITKRHKSQVHDVAARVLKLFAEHGGRRARAT
jgi:hypothetical protein